MYLPLRIAASAPVMFIFFAALVGTLMTPSGRAVHPVYGFPNSFLLAFFAASAGLLLVVPNVLAALLANRLAAGTIVAFAGLFLVAFLVVAIAEGRIVYRFLGAPGSIVEDLRNWRALSVITGNCVLLLILAAYFGRKFDA